MKINNKITKFNWFGLFFGLLAMLIMTAGLSVQAQNKVKKSDRLSKKMSEVSGSDLIDVIINPNGNWSNSLTTALNGKGAVKKKSFTNFSFQVYKVKRSDIDTFVSRSDVDFITLDDTVKTLGHMTTTTGTAKYSQLKRQHKPA